MAPPADNDGDRGQDTFRWIIYLFASGKSKFKTTQKSQSSRHAVLLDTQSTGRNWISSQLVTELGMESEVNRNGVHPTSLGMRGEQIQSEGTIAFEWILNDGATVHGPVTFHVCSTPLQMDMIFGAPYIVEKGLLSSNQDRFLPLVEHKKMKLSEKAREALYKEEQRQGKARVEAENQALRDKEQRQREARVEVTNQAPSLRLPRSSTISLASPDSAQTLHDL